MRWQSEGYDMFEYVVFFLRGLRREFRFWDPPPSRHFPVDFVRS